MIETARLNLKPLTYAQLVKYLAADGSLEKELQLNTVSRTISQELKEALEETILPNVADTAKNYLYNTLWSAIAKESNQIIGDLCIIGEPNAAGEIEIGYGTYDEFQGKGYMTEIVEGIILWAKTQSLVKSIKASTEKKMLLLSEFLRKITLLKWVKPILSLNGNWSSEVLQGGNYFTLTCDCQINFLKTSLYYNLKK